MNVLLLHIGADVTNPGVIGPIFPDGSFEFIPIKNIFGLEARNKQHGQTLADFLPRYIANLHPSGINRIFAKENIKIA